MRVWYWRLPEGHTQDFTDLIHILAYFGSSHPLHDESTVNWEWTQFVNELLAVVGNAEILEDGRLPALLAWARDFFDVSNISSPAQTN